MLIYEGQNNNEQLFLNATNIIHSLTKSLDKKELLLLYGLYKQALCGNNTTSTPFIVDLKAVSKWNAWYSHKGKPKRVAVKEYIELVDALLLKYQ